MNKKECGITLIALVITIVVLLILAGISLSITIGKNGILEKSKESKEKTEIAREKEILDLATTDAKLAGDFSRNNLEKAIKMYENNVEVTENDESYVIEYKTTNRIYEINKSNDFDINIDEENLSYVKEGLMVWYDGIDNTRSGHSNNTTKWENLSNEGSKYDANLINFNFNDNSGWTDNSLIIDGINDWVQMFYMYNENMTVEIVVKQLNKTKKKQYYICNVEQGGVGVLNEENGKNAGIAFIGTDYILIKSDKDAEIGKKYSLSTRYDNSKLFFRENDDVKTLEITGKGKGPNNNSVFVLGTNPNGKEEDLPSDNDRIKTEVYSVRIYNRCLTEAEVNANYNIDKQRFNIN